MKTTAPLLTHLSDKTEQDPMPGHNRIRDRGHAVHPMLLFPPKMSEGLIFPDIADPRSHLRRRKRKYTPANMAMAAAAAMAM